MALEANLLPDEYLPLLDELNRIVIESGELLEGNLFYYHNHQIPPSRDSVYSEMAPKRSNFASACKAGTRMLEIGFNAGHSCLLALAAGVEYHGVDNCHHAYTRPAALFLKQKFGNRFHFHAGNSRHVLPQLHAAHPQLCFNLIHIDGSQHIDYVRADTYNALTMALNNTWLIIDDTNVKEIQDFYKDLILNKTIVTGHPDGWKYYWAHAIGQIRYEERSIT